jgi:hypothetical protein
MNEGSARLRAVSLTFSGFKCSPSEVERQMGVRAGSMVLRGQPTKSGRATYRKSSIEFSIEVSADTRLVAMIPALLDHLGGVERILQVISEVQPEDVTIEFLLPIRNSESVEDGYIDRDSIAALHRLRASVGFLIP